jgi:hypothetical protein
MTKNNDNWERNYEEREASFRKKAAKWNLIALLVGLGIFVVMLFIL